MLIFILAILVCYSTAIVTLPAAEYSALQDLFDSTQGFQWKWVLPYNPTNGYPWNFTNPYYSNPCNASYPWQGVTCITEGISYHVSQVVLPSLSARYHKYYQDIMLPHLFLSAPSHSSLTSIHKFRIVYLAGNLLNGSIPTDIEKFVVNLVVLDLSMNLLTGTIPKSIANL